MLTVRQNCEVITLIEKIKNVILKRNTFEKYIAIYLVDLYFKLLSKCDTKYLKMGTQLSSQQSNYTQPQQRTGAKLLEA